MPNVWNEILKKGTSINESYLLLNEFNSETEHVSSTIVIKT